MRYRLLGSLLAAILTSALTPTAFASPVGLQPPIGYQIGEQNFPDGGGAGDAPGTAGQGPIRLARFSYVQGDITWRPNATADWAPAAVNLPLRQGAQVWVTNGGRAEVQFDDGSLLRLGNGAVVTLQTLYSDSDGEFTEVQMNEGLVALRLRSADSLYQVDTPLAAIKAAGPAKIRIGVDNDVEVAEQGGRAEIEGGQGKAILRSGDYVDIADSGTPLQVEGLPDPDSWDRWNNDRDQELRDADSDRYLPPDIALVAGSLDQYGDWHNDPQYGWVWSPTIVEAGWRPYYHGHWVWVDPFGWTWVSSENWGWAPYHYGTRVNLSSGWAWVPGPAQQYWCPAVVHFSEYNGAIAWCPLAPHEVHYPPTLSIGLHSGDWSFHFSIGGCAVYYPAGNSYCAPRPWNNVYVNRTVYVNKTVNVYNNVTTINNTTINRNVYVNSYHFVPQNAQTAGVSTAAVAAFGGRGVYQQAPRAGAAFFVRGRQIGAPAGSARPFAGPISPQPTSQSFTPSRSFLPAAHPNMAVLQRPVFRTALPRRVVRFAPSLPNATPTARPPFNAAMPRRFGGGTQRAFSPADHALQAQQGRGQTPAGGPVQDNFGGPRPPRHSRNFQSGPTQTGQSPPQFPQPDIRPTVPSPTVTPPHSRPQPQMYHYHETSGLDTHPSVIHHQEHAGRPRGGPPKRQGGKGDGGSDNGRPHPF